MSYHSPLLELPGSIPAPEGHPDEGVPWHWGDPFAEQRTAARSVAVVDRSDREVLAVRGEDRLSWLHLVISQHVTGLPEESGTEALVLDSYGRIESHLVLAHVGATADGTESTVYLDTRGGAEITSALPNGGKQSPIEYFEAMKFWSKIGISDVTGELATLTLLGPDAPSILAALDIDLPERAYSVAAFSGGFARRMPWPGRSSVDLLVPRADLVQWWNRITDAGARPVGSWTFEALRVESLRPRLGADTDERTIPHEVNWIGSAAHVAKGCYRGQETVSKVHNVGRPPRHLVLLHLDGSPEITPETGDPVTLGDRTVGRVGSVVQHHELGPIALALLKRSAPVDAEFLTGKDDHVVQAAVDPDSVPEEGEAPGRAAAQALRG